MRKQAAKAPTTRNIDSERAMPGLDRKAGSFATKHSVVAQSIREDIQSGIWAPGERIPSEKVIAKTYGVAYMTARQAVTSLVAEGTLERVARKGTYVASAKNPSDARNPSNSAHNSGSTNLFRATSLDRFVFLVEGGKTSLDPYYLPPIMEAFEREISVGGYGLSIYGYSVDVLDRLVSKDALVCCVLLSEQDVLYAKLLRERGNRVYAINRCEFGGFVAPDNIGGAEMAVRHLVALGHRRIAFVRGLPGNIDARDRQHGYLQGMSKHSLRSGPQEGDHFIEACGHAAAIKMLESDDPPTAIFCASDLSAIGAMKAIAEAGLSVPQDISVVGFGDFPLAKFLHPGLTTVRLPLAELGATAARKMLLLSEGESVDDVLLSCELAVRDTTGPVSKPSMDAKVG